jgi:DNA gyrase subunit A
MDNIIYKLYKEYGIEANKRTLPLIDDGLKLVERRMLYTVYEIARNKFIKSIRVEGHCLGHYSPHSGAYKTLVQLVYKNFVDGMGNFGLVNDNDLGYAAARYTEVQLNQKMIPLVFELIDYIPKIEIDLDPEPLFLPTKYPLCLLGKVYSIGIGFGFKTLIPCYELSDLYKRLLFLKKVRKNKPIIKPISNCDILSLDSDLEKLLTTGKADIKIKGKFRVDYENSQIILKSWPFTKKLEWIISKLENEFKDCINIDDFSDSETNIVLTITRIRNKSEILKLMIEKLEELITSTIHFEIIVVDLNGNVKLASVDELLLKSYNNYFETTKTMLNSKIKDYNDLKEEDIALLKIRPVLSKCIKGKNQIVVDEIIKEIHEKTSVCENFIKFLFSKYHINKLLTLNIDIEEIDNKIKEYENNLNNIHQYILNKYAEVVK